MAILVKKTYEMKFVDCTRPEYVYGLNGNDCLLEGQSPIEKFVLVVTHN